MHGQRKIGKKIDDIRDTSSKGRSRVKKYERREKKMAKENKENDRESSEREMREESDA